MLLFLLANEDSCRSETSKHTKPFLVSQQEKVFFVDAARAVCILAAFTGLLCDSFYPRGVQF